MRKFFSYGPPDIEDHYYAPRKKLVDKLYQNLTGNNPRKGGHYFTVWAPRQTGKSWRLNTVCRRISREDGIVDINRQNLEIRHTDTETGTLVKPVFIETGT